MIYQSYLIWNKWAGRYGIMIYYIRCMALTEIEWWRLKDVEKFFNLSIQIMGGANLYMCLKSKIKTWSSSINLNYYYLLKFVRRIYPYYFQIVQYWSIVFQFNLSTIKQINYVYKSAIWGFASFVPVCLPDAAFF